jgi:hypothetical protein
MTLIIKNFYKQAIYTNFCAKGPHSYSISLNWLKVKVYLVRVAIRASAIIHLTAYVS